MRVCEGSLCLRCFRNEAGFAEDGTPLWRLQYEHERGETTGGHLQVAIIRAQVLPRNPAKRTLWQRQRTVIWVEAAVYDRDHVEWTASPGVRYPVRVTCFGTCRVVMAKRMLSPWMACRKRCGALCLRPRAIVPYSSAT